MADTQGKEITPVQEIRSTVNRMSNQFGAVLPPHIPVERFVRTVQTAVATTPALVDCDRNSLYAAAMKAAQDGLLPDGREGAIIPRNGKAAWQPMVAGIMKKVRNSGEISTWAVHTVHENDAFDYQLGDEEFLRHKPALRDRGEITGAYSIVRMKDGEISREYMGIDEIHAIRNRSDGYLYAVRNKKQNPWITDPGEMCKKTVTRRHSKRLPMSTDLDELMRREDEDMHAAETGRREEKEVVDTQTGEVTTMPEKKRASSLQGVVDITKRGKEKVVDVTPEPDSDEPPLPTVLPPEEDRDYL
jgi:recombination protein RecT